MDRVWRSGDERVRFPKLYPILDAELVHRGMGPVSSTDLNARRNLLRRLVRELSDAGIEILQYRNKRDPDDLVSADTLAMREAASHALPKPMQLILNDRAALVTDAGWDGVHIGQDDLSPKQARLLVGPAATVGFSTHNEKQVIASNPEPVDYIAIGPVFATASKFDTSPVIGLEGVRRARALTSKPLVAIGGITRDNAPAVYEAGADSVAVISAIFGASGRTPAQSAKDFLEVFK
jgi:thiamine-phosphate pyrophosphorylase